MVGRMIKTLKHGFTIASSFNVQGWDLQVPKILFMYRYGIQANTKYSPYMILIKIRVEN
jgi:hypothetical protein